MFLAEEKGNLVIASAATNPNMNTTTSDATGRLVARGGGSIIIGTVLVSPPESKISGL